MSRRWRRTCAQLLQAQSQIKMLDVVTSGEPRGGSRQRVQARRGHRRRAAAGPRLRQRRGAGRPPVRAAGRRGDADRAAEPGQRERRARHRQRPEDAVLGLRPHHHRAQDLRAAQRPGDARRQHDDLALLAEGRGRADHHRLQPGGCAGRGSSRLPGRWLAAVQRPARPAAGAGDRAVDREPADRSHSRGRRRRCGLEGPVRHRHPAGSAAGGDGRDGHRPRHREVAQHPAPAVPVRGDRHARRHSATTCSSSWTRPT